jgi:hypothetical protein
MEETSDFSLLSACRTATFGGPPKCCQMSAKGLSAGVERLERKADHSLWCSTKVKNMWGYTYMTTSVV